MYLGRLCAALVLAGGWAVALHVSLPSSAGLFSAAVSESIPGWEFADTSQAYKNTWNTFTNLGCPRLGTSAEQLTCLRDTSVPDLYAATPSYNLLYLSEPQNQIFSPVVDGIFVPHQVREAFATGKFNKVPYIIGGTSNEGLFMLSTAFTELGALTMEDILVFIETVYPGIDYRRVLATHPEENYAGCPAPVLRRFGDIWTDVYMVCPMNHAMSTMWHSKMHVYRYLFTHIPKCPFRTIPLAGRAVAHDDDVFFVFNHTDNIPSPDGVCNFTEAEKSLANLTARAWGALARNGEPTLGDDLSWIPWDPQQQSTLILETPPRVQALDCTQRCSVYWEYLDAQRRKRKANISRESLSSNVVEAW